MMTQEAIDKYVDTYTIEEFRGIPSCINLLRKLLELERDTIYVGFYEIPSLLRRRIKRLYKIAKEKDNLLQELQPYRSTPIEEGYKVVCTDYNIGIDIMKAIYEDDKHNITFLTDIEYSFIGKTCHTIKNDINSRSYPSIYKAASNIYDSMDKHFKDTKISFHDNAYVNKLRSLFLDYAGWWHRDGRNIRPIEELRGRGKPKLYDLSRELFQYRLNDNNIISGEELLYGIHHNKDIDYSHYSYLDQGRNLYSNVVDRDGTSLTKMDIYALIDRSKAIEAVLIVNLKGGKYDEDEAVWMDKKLVLVQHNIKMLEGVYNNLS